MTPPSPVLASLLLLSDHGQGHVRDYNEAVSQAARLAGWTHRAALVKNWQGTNLPPEWEVCLECPNLENYWARNLGYGPMASSVTNYIRERLLPGGRPVILFVENLSTSTLIVLWLALQRVPREQLALWLLVRFSLRERGFPGRVSRVVLRLLRRRLRPGALQLLTDSQPLAQSLAAFTGQPFTVMPVPHTDVGGGSGRDWPDAQAARSGLVCWWPGAPRPEKGLAVMRALAARSSPAASRLELVAAETAGLRPTPGGPRLRALPPGLDRAAYLNALADCQMILLPYDAQAYRERTSGIFIEALAARKIPVVPAGTWMAAELAAFGLGELVVDWEAPDLPDQLLDLAARAELRPKLERMRADYARRHGLAAYARMLQNLYAQAQRPTGDPTAD